MTETYEDRYSQAESATRYIKQRVEDIAPNLDSDNNDSSEGKRHKLKPALWTSVIAGGFAGVVVDFSLYPLDTIKTRLQSKDGFAASGGFRKVYKGIIPVLLCSAPLSALFFGTYNTLANTLKTKDSSWNPLVYLTAASMAEVLCSCFRVPVEIIKQRKQISNTKSIYIIEKILRKEGFIGFYRGFWTVIMREIPFATIQYPMWEYMIDQWIIYQNGKSLTALQTAYCGALAGAVAAIFTTPVDVIKTRIMLAEKEKIEQYKPSVHYNFAKEVFYDRGITGFFSGVIPRTLWIMLGGFIYFGAYEKAKIVMEQEWHLFEKPVKRCHELTPSRVEEKIENVGFYDVKRENSQIVEDDDKQNLLLPQEQKPVDIALLKPLESSVKEE